MNPREFYNTHVLENYNEWINDHTNEVKAMNAVSAANNLAAYVFHYLREKSPSMLNGAKNEGEYRAYVANSLCPDFQIVWDIADGHKHVQLRRAEREVDTLHRALRWNDDTTLRWNEATFSWTDTRDMLMAELASGEFRVLRVTVKRVLDFWSQLLEEAGI